MNADIRFGLTQGVADLDEEAVLHTVESCLATGEDPLALIAACEAGMRLVGERYERQEYFLSGLIMAGEIFREVLELIQPALKDVLPSRGRGKILIGTVKGDIHDIGKNLLGMALRSYGFTVDDLGVDVSPQRFVERALAWQPDIVGLSFLLTQSYDSARETVRLLKEQVRPDRRLLPVIIGGMTNEIVRRYVGADYWSIDALEGVRICQQILGEAPRGLE